MNNIFRFEAAIWEYGGEGSWHFVTLPEQMSSVIKEVSDSNKAFGSVKVLVQLADSKWLTSIFPDSKTNSFVLPIKKEIRNKNNLSHGSKVKITITPVNL